jgi:hypothetical protein
VSAFAAAAMAGLDVVRESEGQWRMLKGSKRGLVKKIQPVSIHGQISLDVYFVDPDDPEGQVSLARIGPESVPRDLEAGEHVDLHYLLGSVTQITRPG